MWLDTSENGIELTLNNIVKIVNQIGPDDERLNEVFRKIEQEHKNKQESRLAVKDAALSHLNRLTIIRYSSHIPALILLIFLWRTHLKGS